MYVWIYGNAWQNEQSYRLKTLKVCSKRPDQTFGFFERRTSNRWSRNWTPTKWQAMRGVLRLCHSSQDNRIRRIGGIIWGRWMYLGARKRRTGTIFAFKFREAKSRSRVSQVKQRQEGICISLDRQLGNIGVTVRSHLCHEERNSNVPGGSHEIHYELQAQLV